MSKNLTRKGLAFGAIVALGASLFSAVPAFAADELTLAPKTGTAYKIIDGETFTLQTGLAPSTPAGNTVQLKYSVTTTATFVTTTAVNGAATTKVTAGQPTNTYVLKETATPTVGALQTIALTSAGTLTTGNTTTAAVTAFFDANSNDVLDAGEYSSAARTITWIPAVDATTTVTIGALTAGDTSASATVSFVGLNNSQIPKAHVGVYFTKNDGSNAGVGSTLAGITTGVGKDVILATTGTQKLTYSSTKDVFSASTDTMTAVSVTAGSLVNQSVRAIALYDVAGDGTATPATTSTVGKAATLDAVARTINQIDVVATGDTGVAAGAAVQAVPGTAGSLAVAASNVKGNTVKLVATVKDNATTPVAVAGAAFKVTVAGTQVLGTANSISINGTAYTAALTAALDATTDASGQITLTVANATALTAGGTVTLAITGQNITNTVTITYAAPTYSIYDVADNAGSFNRTVAKGAAYSVTYKVVDQFGDAPSVASSTATYRLEDVVTTTNTGTYYATVAADGTATLSWTTAATAGNTVNTVKLQKSIDSFANWYYATTTGGFHTVANTTSGADVNIVTTVVVKATAAEVTASKITLGNPTAGAGQNGTNSSNVAAAVAFTAGVQNSVKAALANTAFSAYEGRFAKTSIPTLAKGYVAAPIHTAGAWTAGTTTALVAGDAKITIPVTVNDSTLAATALDGVSTTVAAKGMLFVVTGANGKVTMGVDSLTFLADNGSTNVDVYSHVTGEQSIVFTSGAVSKTQKITFTNYGTEVAAVALGTLAAQAQAGSTLALSAVATDKWGNVVPNVQIAFSNTGAGYVQDTAAQLTDSKGAVSGRLIVLQNDLGTSYITATAAKAKTLLSADLASAKSVEFGLVDADVVAGGHRVFVNAEFAKGRTITVTVDGKRLYSKVQTTDNAVELAFTQKKAGVHTVTVRISGGVVFTEKVTTN